jgi:CheY-like chemotaxis protein
MNERMLSMKKVLIVDDAYTIRLKTELLLRHAGRYSVQAVGSGAEALEAALADIPDVIIMDIAMSEMDGFQTLELLRNHNVTCPVIAYTGHPELLSGDSEQHGFAAYILKSESVSSLIAVVRRVLNQQATPLEEKAVGSERVPTNDPLPFRKPVNVRSHLPYSRTLSA